MSSNLIFADTSGLMALMDKDDVHHHAAVREWKTYAADNRIMLTTDYVRLECCSLIQRRLGALVLQDFYDKILPVVRITHVGEDGFERAFAQWRIVGRRRLSLVDITSFDSMRQRGISFAFTFDRHFKEQGYTVCSS